MALPTVIAAAEAAVTAGTSIAGTTIAAMNNTGYSVSVGIEVENWTRFPLSDPAIENVGGQVKIPPTTVAPGKREGLVVHKTSGTATGTYGTVSWLVEGKNRRMVVMWEAPYNFDFYTNYLAVGLTDEGRTLHPSGDTWYQQMYYQSSGNGLHFVREQYYYSSNAITYSDGGLQVQGIMGTSHTPTVKIVLRPTANDDLAASIKAELA